MIENRGDIAKMAGQGGAKLLNRRGMQSSPLYTLGSPSWTRVKISSAMTGTGKQ